MKKEKKIQEYSMMDVVTKSLDFLLQFKQTNLFAEIEDKVNYNKSYKSIVYSAISKIARTTASIQWSILNSKDEKIENHRVEKKLRKPNPLMVWDDLIELTIIHMYIYGSAYWFWDKENLYVILPFLLNPKSSNGLTIDYYEAPSMVGKKRFEVDEIVHFKFNNPISLVDGDSVVKKVDWDFDIINQAKKTTAYFFKNNGIPAGVFSSKQPAKEKDLERIEKRWNEKFGGAKNKGKVAFMFGDWQWIPVSEKPNTDTYIDPAVWSRDDILATLGVPPALLGYYNDINRSNAEVSNEMFMRDTIAPLARKISNTINYKFIQEMLNENIKFVFDEITVENSEIKMKQEELKIKKAQIGFMTASLTIDEIRELLGFAKIGGTKGNKTVDITQLEKFDEIKELMEILKQT